MKEIKDILLVDDDESFLKIYARILQTKGYYVQTANHGEAGLKFLKDRIFPVIITDMVMPGMTGLDFLKEVKRNFPELQVIVLTGEGSIPGAVEAMRLGAYTYLIKPVNIEELLLNVDRAFQLFDMGQENFRLKTQLAAFEEQVQLLGESPAIIKIKQTIEIVASSNATVLITGESGTGKEIVANLIHRKSGRAGGPLIKVNCAALAESILESELFGHEKGAFTGATATKVGRFELADGGTLFWMKLVS